ncbi:citrate synthase [Mariniphaga anaerophila]|uniref:Citrate synthase n=1 Tax=Mariniphaga anaerophila TaxID=1484053 RepID=A0A1M4ZQ86_9BACT|nr:citrate synthase [Mariniphaga anaerophila]SHF20164.1 citrate synthase [Mariniphaga anaerophila]
MSKSGIPSVVKNLSESVEKASKIDPTLFEKFNVKRGLRNADHSGVLVGLTNIGDVVGYKKEGDVLVPTEGKLFYRGIDVEELVNGATEQKRHGFDEVTYLLLSGKLPSGNELGSFMEYMGALRKLPDGFTNSMILANKGENIMNILARTVLALYTLDDNAEDISTGNLVDQSLNLIAKFPTIIAYSYHSMRHFYQNKTLSIRHPNPDLSTAENFLMMMKGEGKYTRLEADILDLALILHAEHGGGNNSTFTIRVTSSTHTDTYSAVASALGSLKGPLHGGANHKVLCMMDNIKKNVKHWDDKQEVSDYLIKILNKQANDLSGKIYGIGHAVYTISDPRAKLLKKQARELAKEKGRLEEYELYEMIENLAPQIFYDYKGDKVAKRVCANVDFYSGFVYNCIGIKEPLYTPLFAMSRISGWCAHRLEELTFGSGRIIRPAYKNVFPLQNYISLDDRN